jgi:hypothetical protein
MVAVHPVRRLMEAEDVAERTGTIHIAPGNPEGISRGVDHIRIAPGPGSAARSAATAAAGVIAAAPAAAEASRWPPDGPHNCEGPRAAVGEGSGLRRLGRRLARKPAEIEVTRPRDSEQKREPMMAPEPPVDFVRRPAEFEALKAKLLDAKGDAVAISAALKGAGGYGKTTLAKALAHDPDIQDAYFDGVLWIELGEKPDNLLGKIADRITILTGTPPGLATIDAAAAALGDALGDRRILMIVDDVWRDQDLRPFLQGGRHTTRLITTQLNRVLPDAFRQPVDAMTGGEARELLSSGLPKEQTGAESAELGDLCWSPWRVGAAFEAGQRLPARTRDRERRAPTGGDHRRQSAARRSRTRRL